MAKKYEIDIKVFIELDSNESGDAFGYNLAKKIQMHEGVFGTKTTVTELNRAQEKELEDYLKSRDPRRAW